MVEDNQQFNNLINDLIRMNYHQTGGTPGQKSSKVGVKERANSEKTQSSQAQGKPQSINAPVCKYSW